MQSLQVNAEQLTGLLGAQQQRQMLDLNGRLEFLLVPPLFLFHLVNYFPFSDLKPFHLPGIFKPEKRSAISLLPQHLWIRQKKLPEHTTKLFI